MIMRCKLQIIGAVCLFLSGLSWLTEVSFYGDVDTLGVLQESFFAPLSILFAILGIASLMLALFAKAGR